MVSLRDDLKISVEFSTFSFVLIGFTQPLDKLEFVHVVILSERSESKDLRTCFVQCS